MDRREAPRPSIATYMDKSIQSLLLNRLSCASITIATLTLVFIFTTQNPPLTCKEPHPQNHQTLIKFPKSSCESNQRDLITIDKRNKKLWSTKSWRKTVDSFAEIFGKLRNLGFLTNDSKVLCVSAGAGHEVMALSEIGVVDVTGVELLDWPPLVSRADPHDLPFFDGVFDVGFSAHFSESLFPSRFASEMERTVRRGGICVVFVEQCSDDEVEGIRVLFRRSNLVSVSNVTLIGSKMTQIIMRNRGIAP